MANNDSLSARVPNFVKDTQIIISVKLPNTMTVMVLDTGQVAEAVGNPTSLSESRFKTFRQPGDVCN